MEDAFAAGEKVKDANAVAAYYSEDAISYSRNKQLIKGKKAITDIIAKKNMAKETTIHYNVLKIVDVYADSDMAVEVGSQTEYDASGKE